MAVQSGTDRNLLFGILALQMDFISRDQMVAGMHAWVLDKTKPLGQVLVELKHLADDERALLDALVDKHLAKHDGDPQQSLAALSPSGAVREDLQDIVDADVQASLAAAGVARPHDDSMVTRTFSVGESSSAGQRFRIVRPHAEGGLGKVSVAVDEELHREVALKEIKEKHADDPGSRGRFLLEAEITGGLEHPGIVPVYGLGSYADGRPFYAMRFIRGDSLKEAIARFHKRPTTDSTDDTDKNRAESAKSVLSVVNFSGLDFHKLLRRFIDVCNAIAYAHSRGVLHRDLKPGNVMLGKYGETLVVDWGLAKARGRRHQSEPGTSATGEAPASPLDVEQPLSPSGSEDLKTLAGTAIGTPAFMSPEQAAGRHDLLGPASDVYGLGATLFQILTGQPPLRGLPSPDILRRVQKGELPRPRELCPAVPAPLEAVCRKAMALRPDDRYVSPRTLADDVEHWLADEPVSAWPEPITVKARRFIGRNRVSAAGVAAAVVVSAGLLLVGNVLLSQANKDLEKANDDIKIAFGKLEKANDETESANVKLAISEKVAQAAAAKEKTAHEATAEALAVSHMMLARVRFEGNQAGLAEELLTKVPERLRRSPWDLLKNYVAGSVFTLEGHTATVDGVAVSPDGRWLASASWDKSAKIWDAHTHRELRTLSGHAGRVHKIAFSPDGQSLATVSADSTAKLWNARTGREERTLLGHSAAALGVSFSPDGRRLATASLDKSVIVWDVRTGAKIHILRGHSAGVDSVAFSGDGQWLATTGMVDKNVILWNARTGALIGSFHGHAIGVLGVAFSSDGPRMATASNDATVKLWDVRAGKELHTLRGHAGPVVGVAFSPDGRWLASASLDRTVKIWDSRTGQELCTLRGHARTVSSVCFSTDGQWLVSGSYDNTVKLWNARAGDELRTLRGHAGLVSGVDCDVKGRWLASASWDQTAKLWDAWTCRELRTFHGHEKPVICITISRNGQSLATGSLDATVKLWEPNTGKERHTLRGHAWGVNSVAFSPDGRWLVSASADKTVKLWDVATGQERRTFHGHDASVTSAAFSPDGNWLATASQDKTVKLWNTQEDTEPRTLRGHTGYAEQVAFSPNGAWLASKSNDQTVKIWDAHTGAELQTLRGHSDHVMAIAISPDSQWLAIANMDGTVNLWDALTGQELRTFRGHSGPVAGIAISPDGQRLFSASYDGTLKVWDARTKGNSVTGASAPISAEEQRFRHWLAVPDLHGQREQAQRAKKDGSPTATGFHMGWYLAGQVTLRDQPRNVAAHAGWLGFGHDHLAALGALLSVNPPCFDRGGVTSGILTNATGPALDRIVTDAATAISLEPGEWETHALYGAALYRAGAYSQALRELNRARELRGDAVPKVWLAAFLTMTHAKLGQHEQARKWLAQLPPPRDAAWEETALYDLLRPEVEQAVELASPKSKSK